MILLDTHALVWLSAGHRRARQLEERARMFASPASVLEIQFLIEAGRLRLRVASGAADDRELSTRPACTSGSVRSG